jgi:N-methylhydantoinase A
VLHEADMQFQGQSHILTVGVESADVDVTREALVTRPSPTRLLEAASKSSSCRKFRPVLVNLHTAVIGVPP